MFFYIYSRWQKKRGPSFMWVSLVLFVKFFIIVFVGKGKKNHINPVTLRKVFALFAIVFVIASSCAIKAGIKHLFGLSKPRQVSLMQPVVTSFIGHSAHTCVYPEKRAYLIWEANISPVPQPFMAVLILTVLAFFHCATFYPIWRINLYSLDSKRGEMLPVFLQFRQLII